MVTVNGKSYLASDFENGGHNEVVTAGTGEQMIRFLAAIADMLADASRARQTTSATSKNAGLSGSQNWVLAEDIAFANGSYVLIAQTSAPATNFYIGQVTGYVSGTKTLTVAVEVAVGSTAGITDWTISVTGKPNPAAILPLVDSSALVRGSADPTKQLRIEADNLTTETTRALTAQDADGRIALTGGSPFALDNLSLACSVNANALTISLKHANGNDPSAGNPVAIAFRSATAGTGTYSVLHATAATSLTVSSGSTLGTANSTPFRFWVVAFNDGGTLRLGLVNCRSGGNVLPLSDDLILSSTAEGGAGAADSAQVVYTGTAVSSKALRVLGYIEYSSGLATAGTYASGPTKVQLAGPGVPLPGQQVQRQLTATGAAATGTTVIPFDDTIPQSGEGIEFMTQAITPTSAANLLEVEAQAQLANSSTSAKNIAAALFRDSGADALTAHSVSVTANAHYAVPVRLYHALLAGSTSATTFKLRGGSEQAGTTTFNGSNSGRIFGGVMGSFLLVREVMA